VIAVVTLSAMAALLWHFGLWPVLLRRLARPGTPAEPLAENDLPAMALIVPAHNESRWIAEKIANTAALDYPADRLRLVLALDGCTDDTRARAEAALAAPEAAHLRADIVESASNLGKLATLARAVAAAPEPIVALTDTSAILSLDALRRTAAALADPGTGAVGGSYTVFAEGAGHEAPFWAGQTRLKASEAAFGAPMGLHGAYYALRRTLFEPPPPDSINDDFAIPMRLVEQGWRIGFDPAIRAVEREASSAAVDSRRRRRIGAGNVQQSLRHWRLLDPRRPGIALAFASGKGGRPLMPWALLAALAGSLWLAPGSAFFAAAAAAQGAAWLSFGIARAYPAARWPRPVRAAHYVLAAQIASALGGIDYLRGRHRRPWARVAAQSGPETP
jgi:cellulose synthase/poly-beta-1,6-N-acetylglucosamine synthase-like glycosyltransferase